MIFSILQYLRFYRSVGFVVHLFIFPKTFFFIFRDLKLWPVLGNDIIYSFLYCTARQCSPLWRNLWEFSIINPALSPLIKYLVIGQCQKAPNFSAFHWSPLGRLVSIGQHFVTTREEHLPKKDRNKLYYRIGLKRP